MNVTTAPCRTVLYQEQRRLGARFVPFAGWEMPIQFRGIVAEHHAVRKQAGLFDVSHMGRLMVKGPRALELVDGLITNSLGSIPNRKALYCCCCREDGGILDDLIVYRFSPEQILVVCNASNLGKIRDHFAEHLAHQVSFEDISGATALLAVQGPRSFEVLDALGSSAARALGRMEFSEDTLAGIPVTVARTGYTGEDGVEIVCPLEHAPALYVRLLEAGAASGLEPAGLGARDTLRLEARLSLYGHEIDESTHPFEAGLGWTVKLDRGPFIGRDRLRELRSRRLVRTIAGLEMLGHGVARQGYPVLDREGRPLGHVTSGGPSPSLGKNIALAYLPVGLASVGEQLVVDCRGKPIEAAVVPTPFYKRAESR